MKLRVVLWRRSRAVRQRLDSRARQYWMRSHLGPSSVLRLLQSLHGGRGVRRHMHRGVEDMLGRARLRVRR
jgi:hypothetical protein